MLCHDRAVLPVDHRQPPERGFVALGDMVRSVAARTPDKVAIWDGGVAVTYGQFASKADGIASALRSARIARGQAIAICGLNSADYAAIYVGAAMSGIVVAPLPQSGTAEALGRLLVDSGATLLFADQTCPVRDIAGDEVPPIVDMADLDGWLRQSATTPGAVDVGADDVFNIIYSSGTTGRPKGIVQTHGMRSLHVDLAAAGGYDASSVTLVSTPLYSNTTLISFLPTIALGGTVVLMRKFDAGRFLELAQQHRVTHAMLVPVQYERILAHEHFPSTDLSSFRIKFCTSSPLSADLKHKIVERWPGRLVEYYGMTEGGALCILDATVEADKLHTVGKPAAGYDMRLIGDDDREVAAGEVGEVVGASANTMAGYHNQPDLKAEISWRSPDGGTFLRTGDLGRFDADGYLELIGRKKDVIISGGFNVYPSDIEEVIAGHPAVGEVAVVGIASDTWGETPVAFVVAPGASPEELLSFTNAKVGKMQRVAAVFLIDRLPRNAIGKVLKRDLRREAAVRCQKTIEEVN